MWYSPFHLPKNPTPTSKNHHTYSSIVSLQFQTIITYILMHLDQICKKKIYHLREQHQNNPELFFPFCIKMDFPHTSNWSLHILQYSVPLLANHNKKILTHPTNPQNVSLNQTHPQLRTHNLPSTTMFPHCQSSTMSLFWISRARDTKKLQPVFGEPGYVFWDCHRTRSYARGGTQKKEFGARTGKDWEGVDEKGEWGGVLCGHVRILMDFHEMRELGVALLTLLVFSALMLVNR